MLCGNAAANRVNFSVESVYMDTQTKARLADLLLQREATFVKIWECEQRIDALLGQAWPFAIPECYQARLSKKSKAKKQQTNKRIRVRPLNQPSENAYQITFRRGEDEQKELQRDPNIIQLVLETKLPDVTITVIDTVYIDPSGTVHPGSRIYEREEEEGKDRQLE